MTNFVVNTTAAVALTLMGTASFADSLTTSASATALPTVDKIEVTTELDAVENAEAAKVWANIDDDLTAKLVDRLQGRADTDGSDIVIDIDEVSLASSFEQAVGDEKAYLKGDVVLRNPGPDDNEYYTLTVHAEQAQAYFPDGKVVTDLTTGSRVYYQAMLDAFADNVILNLDKSNLNKG